MAIVATKSSSFKKNPMPEGLHEAVISEVKDLGKVNTTFGEKHYVVARITNAEGKEASRFWTPSLHEKSNLFKDYKSIFGVNPPEKLDIETLVGTQVRVLITETVDKANQPDARVEKLMKPTANQNVPITKREKQGQNAPAVQSRPPAGKPDSTEITDEDIPF